MDLGYNQLFMTYATAKAKIRKRLLNAEDGKVSEVVSRELCGSEIHIVQ